MKLLKKKALLILIVTFFAASCGGGGVYIPRGSKVKNVPPPETEKVETKKPAKVKKSSSKTKKGTQEVFNAPFIEVWLAAMESANWIKWNIAFIDDQQGVIRLKEAYTYRKSGKLLRAYQWPNKESLQTSNINDYLAKVGRYNPGSTNTVFTQENLKMDIVRLSEDETKVDIDYTIRPYTFSGKIGYEVESNGFIENLMLERIKENLDERPLAQR